MWTLAHLERMQTLVEKRPSMDNLKHYRCCGKADATGIGRLTRLQLEVGISPSSNGRDGMDATGIGKNCEAAAEGGHLSVLQWARHNGCDWNWKTCVAAAGGGNLSILQWARQNGCDWDSETCEAAAEGGHLSVLQWAKYKMDANIPVCTEFASFFNESRTDPFDLLFHIWQPSIGKGYGIFSSEK